MILKREIEKIAELRKVSKTTVDRDWVLGHFIDAVFSNPVCREKLVFKGGTCLKKCYFKDYRFSEDLDFTSTDTGFVLDKELLNSIISIIVERTEIPMQISKIEQLKFNDRPTGFSAIIKYWGADHPRNQTPPPVERWLTSIKLEIILYEKMVFPPETREVHHEYSDKLSETVLAGIPCYSIQEILAEKLRALIQRSYAAPRDYYDIWFLSRNIQGINWGQINVAFLQKMEFKNIKYSGIDQLFNSENDKQLAAAWKNSLIHQIPGEEFPPYPMVRDEIKELLKKHLSFILSGKHI